MTLHDQALAIGLVLGILNLLLIFSGNGSRDDDDDHTRKDGR